MIELSYVRGLKTKAMRALFTSQLNFYRIAFLTLIALLCLTIEYNLIFSIINDAFGAMVETEKTPENVYILSFSSLIAIIGFHILMKNGDAPFLTNMLRKISQFMIAFYFVGMFLLLATNDLDTIMSGDFENAFISLSNEDETGFVSSILEAAEPYIGILTACAIGGLVFINMIISDTLLNHIYNSFIATMTKVSEARRTIGLANLFSEGAGNLDNLGQQIKRWEAISQEQIALMNISVAEATIMPSLLAAKKLYMRMTELALPEEELHLSSDEPLPHPLPKPETLQNHISKLEKLISDLPEIYNNQK